MTSRNWGKEGQLVGAFLTIPDAFLAELFAKQGFDYLCIDMQHGLIDYRTMVEMVRAVAAHGVRPLVRVSENNQAEIMRALDAGAAGIVVPMVNSAEEAAHAAAACRYPPKGLRSYGPTRARIAQGGSIAELEAVACLVQVETKDGFENLDAIAATPGISGIYIGPSDLALCFGQDPAQPGCHDSMKDRIEQVRLACGRNRVESAIHCLHGDRAAGYLRAGFDLVTVVVDGNIVARAVAAELAVATAG